MAQLVKVSFKLRGNELNRSLSLLASKSKHLPDYLSNKAVLSIAIKAVERMPVVPPAKISAQMESITRAKMTKAKKNKPSRRLKSGATWNDVIEGGAATMITLSRMWRGSKFNVRTGHVFAIDRATFSPGQGQAGFLRKLHETATRMVGARRSSSGFFRLCAMVVRQIFTNAVSKSPVRGIGSANFSAGTAVAGAGKVSKQIGKLAGGRAAQGNGKASFWVTATEPDTKGKPGQALQRIAQPVWQRAVDDEAASIRKYAESLYAGAARQAGFLVK